MNREEAIKYIKSRCIGPNEEHDGTQWSEAMWMAIEALEGKDTNVPTKDCISRQAAIQWVKTECNPYGKPTLDFESGKKVIKHLRQMPSATSQNLTKPNKSCEDDLIRRRDAIRILACEMRAEAMIEGYGDYLVEDYIPEATEWMQDAPTIDAVEVVRCRDCKNWKEWENGVGSCHRSENLYNWFGTDATDYCSFGERREDGE